ncbi:MAG: hypothetical protein AVDCRST_MAG25-178, partial [uncultured Rubrobacteraceae bacterium]
EERPVLARRGVARLLRNGRRVPGARQLRHRAEGYRPHPAEQALRPGTARPGSRPQVLRGGAGEPGAAQGPDPHALRREQGRRRPCERGPHTDGLLRGHDAPGDTTLPRNDLGAHAGRDRADRPVRGPLPDPVRREHGDPRRAAPGGPADTGGPGLPAGRLRGRRDCHHLAL